MSRRSAGWYLLLLALPLALPGTGLAQSDSTGVYVGSFESCDSPDGGEFTALVTNGTAIVMGGEADEEVAFVVEGIPVLPDGSFDYSPAESPGDAAPLVRVQGSVSGGAITGSFHFALESCDAQQPAHTDAFSGTRSEVAGIFSDEAGYYKGTIAAGVVPGSGGSATYVGTTHAILDPIGRGLIFFQIEFSVGEQTESLSFPYTFAIGSFRTFADDEVTGSLTAAGIEPPVVTGVGPDFAGLPLQWNATRVLALQPGAVPPDQLIIDGGPRQGILARASDGTLTRLNEFSPDSMIVADLDNDGEDELVVDLGAGYGIWIIDGGVWRALSPLTAESIVKIDFDADPRDDLAVDFGPGAGVRIWMNDTAWADQSAESPDSMLAWPGDSGIDSLLMDCGPRLGIWFRECHAEEPGIGANQFDTLSPESMIVVDFDRGTPDSKAKVLVDFGPQAASDFRFGHLFDARYGLWLYDPSPFADWVPLSGLAHLAGVSPDAMVTGDVNGNVKDDLIVDFGSSHGVYVLLDGATLLPVTAASPGSMVIGDLDGDGFDELIMDLGPGTGIVAWTLGSGLQSISALSGGNLVVLEREVHFVPEPSATGLTLAMLVTLHALARRESRGRCREGEQYV